MSPYDEVRSLIRRGLPVLQDRDRGGGVVQDRVDQEAAVARDVVLPALAIVYAAAEDVRVKQRHRRARLERRARRDAIGAAIIWPSGPR